jgi:hypothetical protein
MEKEELRKALHQLGITEWKLENINGQRQAIFKRAGVTLVDQDHVIDVVAERDYFDMTFLEKCPHAVIADFLEWPPKVVSKMMANKDGRIEVVAAIKSGRGWFRAFLRKLTYEYGNSVLFSEDYVGFIAVYTGSGSNGIGTVYLVFFNQDAWNHLGIKKSKQ